VQFFSRDIARAVLLHRVLYQAFCEVGYPLFADMPPAANAGD
jgi:hypothetical protein